MVRRLVPLLLVLAAAALVAPTAQADTLSGTLPFAIKGQKQDPPCASGALICGPVAVDPVGVADFAFTPGTLTGTGSCLSADATSSFAFSPDDVLVLDMSGHPCFPGNSANAPGAAHSFGTPVKDSGSWSVSGDSTGIFTGATGSGTYTLKWAGAQAFWTFTGTVDY